MKLTSLYKSFFLGAALSLVGCAGEEMVSDIDSVSRAVPITLNVSSGAVTRTVLSEGEDGRMNSVWVEGDVLEVVDAEGNRVGTLALEKGDGSDAVFSGKITGAVDGATYRLWYLGGSNNGNGPYTTAYQYGNNCYECIWGTSMDYRQSGSEDDLVRAELLTEEVTLTLDGEKAYAKNSVTLKPQLAMAHFTLTNIPDELCDLGNDSQSKLTVSSCDANGSNQLPYRYYIEMNSAKFSEPTIAATYGFQISDVAYVKGNSQAENHADIYLALFPGTYKLTFDLKYGEKEYRYTFQNPTDIKAGMYYCASGGKGISVEMEDVTPEPAGDPEVVGPSFEITDRDGKKIKVKFTRANLHYATQTETWYIPERQTDFKRKAGRAVGYDGKYTTEPDIDLFRFGATGYSDFNKTVVSPVMEMVSSWQKDGTYFPYRPSSGQVLNTINSTISMRTKDHQYVDWGWMYSYLLNGKKIDDNFEDKYFTLKSDEWQNVLNTYVHTCATVAGVKGVLLLPYSSEDEAVAALKNAGVDTRYFKRLINSYFNNHKTEFTWTMINIAEYEKLEELNAVFFPAVGSHIPGNSNPSSDVCCYWSANCNDAANRVGFYVYVRLLVGGNTTANLEYGGKTNKSMACSVRLVKVVKE